MAQKTTKKMITVGEYLLMRLQEMGIEHLFGVPGDYNLGFLDQVMACKKIKWVGNCNELNGSYAADGYARIHGSAALLTTFGVGELSAINGIAGSYAEHLAVINIVGVPSGELCRTHALMHHSLGTGRLEVFSDIYRDVTAAQAWLKAETAGKEIDRLLTTAWHLRRPVYIALPTDVSYAAIPLPEKPLDLTPPPSPASKLEKPLRQIYEKLQKAKRPVILLDAGIQRFGMAPLVQQFIEKTGIPFASMSMGKAILDEDHPLFLGLYGGKLSDPDVQACVENSDLVLEFGTIMCDFNTGDFTAHLTEKNSIEIHADQVRVGKTLYQKTRGGDLLKALLEKGYRYSGSLPSRASAVSKVAAPTDKKITHDRFWPQILGIIQPGAVVIAEVGSSLFGLLPLRFPKGVTFINQSLWASIGYTLGALLGVCLSAPEPQKILFIGDGSFQLTAQEISTLLREKCRPLIFVINNDGYTIERCIRGAEASYNDVQPWKYAELPRIFGDDVWTSRVVTETELAQALKEYPKDRLCLIEVKMEKLDMPPLLRTLGSDVAKLNHYQK
jgi:TPP-dependent 2-oxoacid decarboxylase